VQPAVPECFLDEGLEVLDVPVAAEVGQSAGPLAGEVSDGWCRHCGAVLLGRFGPRATFFLLAYFTGHGKDEDADSTKKSETFITAASRRDDGASSPISARGLALTRESGIP
jgi:hypothetical protein